MSESDPSTKVEPAAADTTASDSTTTPSVTIESTTTTITTTTSPSPSTSTPSPPPSSSPSPSPDAPLVPLSPRTLSKRVLKQVEFYFSDSNLPKDAFLKGLYDADPQHYVDLSTIASFKRMRALGPIADLPSILSASTTLTLSPDLLKVTRSTPLPPSPPNTDPSTTLARGFHPPTTTLDFISAFFAHLLADDAAVLSVRLRKDPATRVADGSAWVEFASKELAEKVAGGEGGGLYEYEWKGVTDGTGKQVHSELHISTKKGVEGEGGGLKGQEGEKQGEESKGEGEKGQREGEGKADGGRVTPGSTAVTTAEEGGGDRVEVKGTVHVLLKADALPLFKDTPHTSSDTPRSNKRKAPPTATPQPSADGSAAGGEGGEAAVAEVDPDEGRVFTRDLLVRFDAVNVEATTRESMRALVEGVGGEVVFVDFSKGEEGGVVRLGESGVAGGFVGATEVVRRLKGEAKGEGEGQEGEGKGGEGGEGAGGGVAMELDGIKPEVRAMEGEEETAYWKAVWQQMREFKDKKSKEKRGGRGRGRGGRGGWASKGRGGGGGGGRGGRGGGRGGRGGGRGGKRQRT